MSNKGTIEFRNRQWDVRLYEKGDDLSFTREETDCGMDTEFEVCDRGEKKNLVIMQVAWNKKGLVDIVMWEDVSEYLREVGDITAENPPVWNLFSAGVDLDAVNYRDTHLYSLLFEKDPQKVCDMMMRLSLYEQFLGIYRATLGLQHYVKEYLGETLSKDDDVRLDFRQDKELTDEDILYAALDAVATLGLAMKIPKQRLEDEKTRGSVALYFTGERGYPADRVYLKEQQRKEMEHLNANYRYLADWGIWPSKIMTKNEETGEILPQPTGMKGGTTEFQRVLHQFENRFELQFKRTATAEKKGTDTISTANEDAERAFLKKGYPVHPLITKYKGFKHAEKMLSSYLKPEYIGKDGRWHPRFNPMMKNGRTSAVRPAIQTLPKDGGHRGIFCAEPGHLILAVDVCQAELCALSQANYTRFGRSKMRELINEGMDLHRWFAMEYICSRIYEEDWDLLSSDRKSSMRKDAKPVNFGLPGGLGVTSFQSYALNSWGREFDSKTAGILRDSWFEAYPENREHLKPTKDKEWTLRRMMTEVKENVKDKSRIPKLRTVGAICSFLSDLGWTEDELNNFCFRNGRYRVETFQGHIIRNCGFTDACNYAFSVPTADIMSDVLGESEKRNLPLVNFVHDEVQYHLSMKDEDKLQDQVRECTSLIQDITQKHMPDVLIKVEPALMRRWDKSAEPIWNDDGTLGIWDESLKED